MAPHTIAPSTTVTNLPGHSDRRRSGRTPTLISLRYSCMDAGQLLIGDGIITDLSASGISIRGNQSIAAGMEVTIFIDLPGAAEPFCTTQGRVSWIEGCRFGVKMGPLTLEGKNRLRFIL